MNNNTQGIKEEFNRFWGYNMCNQFEFDEIKTWVESKIALAVSEREKEIVEIASKRIGELKMLYNNADLEAGEVQGINWIIDKLTKPSLSQGVNKEIK